jgi:hypothetical protein
MFVSGIHESQTKLEDPPPAYENATSTSTIDAKNDAYNITENVTENVAKNVTENVTENVTDNVAEIDAENEDRAYTGMDRDAYWQKVRLIANLIPTSLDHLSDILGMKPFYQFLNYTHCR